MIAGSSGSPSATSRPPRPVPWVRHRAQDLANRRPIKKNRQGPATKRPATATTEDPTTSPSHLPTDSPTTSPAPSVDAPPQVAPTPRETAGRTADPAAVRPVPSPPPGPQVQAKAPPPATRPAPQKPAPSRKSEVPVLSF